MTPSLIDQIILIVLAVLGIPGLFIAGYFLYIQFFGKGDTPCPPGEYDPKGPWQL